MVNKNIKWLLFIHTDINKTDLFKVYEFNSIKQMSYILGIEPQIISNYYHNLIKDRGVLKYCIIYQISHK